MTEQEKMLKGMIYDPSDEELVRKRIKAHLLSKAFNDTPEDDEEKRSEILNQLIPNMGEGTALNSPIAFDYGIFTSFGTNCFANFNFTVLDVCRVSIGDNVFVGPNVSVLTPKHPLVSEERNVYIGAGGQYTDREYGAPVKIGNNCWIAGNVTILAGAEIGDGCVIGAGSFVAGKIPDNSLAYGVPCKRVRGITEADRMIKNNKR